MIKLNRPKFIDVSEYKNYLDWHAEPKLDGQRCTLHVTANIPWLIREGGTIKNNQYPEIAKCFDLPNNIILDGEICVLENQYRANFVNMLQRETSDPLRIRILEKRIPATFVAFDILKYDDKDVRYMPLKERRKLLGKIPTNKNIQIITPESVESLISKMCGMNMEGLVLKNPNENYFGIWHKIKNYIESDFIIKGVTSEHRLISALELIDSDGNYIGKVNYTGPQTEIIKNSVVGKTAVVRYMNNGTFRFPVLKEIR